MPKVVEYDVSDVEESQGGTGVKVPVGVRVAKISIAQMRDQKSDGSPANDIRVAFNFGDEWDWGFSHVGLGQASDWKLAEFVRAVGLKEKGKIDQKVLDKIVANNTFVRVKVNPGTYEGEYSPDMGRIMKALDGDAEAWAEGNGSASELSTNKASGPDADESGSDEAPRWREGQPDPENPDDIVGSYDDWEDADLEAEVNDRELTLPGGRSSKRNKMIAALRADDEEAGNDDAEPAAAAADGGGDGNDDYDEWDLDALKKECSERNIDIPTVRGSNAEGRLTAKLIEALREDDESNPFDS